MAKKLLSPEEVKASKVEATKKYLEHAENVLSELLGPLFGPEDERIHGIDDLSSKFLAKAMRLRGLVMAMRRYPSFDHSCLSSMKKFTHVQRVGSFDKSVEVMVPTFGIVAFGRTAEARFSLTNERNFFELGQETRIDFDFTVQRKNMGIMREANLEQWNGGELMARCPTIPTDVRQRIDEALPCFNVVSIVWEAEWGPAPVVDPLVIGSIDEYHFLIDQYDVTKLERYISSEMTRSPMK